MTDRQASLLFAGENTMADVERIIDQIEHWELRP